jgi:hypothetical protein
MLHHECGQPPQSLAGEIRVDLSTSDQLAKSRGDLEWSQTRNPIQVISIEQVPEPSACMIVRRHDHLDENRRVNDDVHLLLRF